MKKEVNAIGDICPIPLVKAKEAIKELNGAGVVKVKDQEYRVMLTVGETDEQTTQKTDSETAKNIEECIPCAPAKKTSLVVISSKTMGGPNEQLGAILLKGFIYALTQQDELPDQILFYNGGAFLTCEGSESLEDLKSLEAPGWRRYKYV